MTGIVTSGNDDNDVEGTMDSEKADDIDTSLGRVRKDGADV